MSLEHERVLAAIPRTNQKARELVRARSLVARLGPERSLAALRAALRPGPGRLELAVWGDGFGPTFTGTTERPNPYVQRLVLSLAELRALFERNASRVRDKFSGLALSYARIGPTGGSACHEALARTALFCDADERGEPDRLLSALRSVGCAYICSRKVRDSSFHLTIPFARPLPLVPTPAFKASYSARTCAVYGALSELGGLACDADRAKDIGFDPAPAGRFAGIELAYHQRAPGDPLPVFEHFDGLGLDLDAFLAALGWTPEPPPPPPPRRAVPGGSPLERVDWLEVLEVLRPRPGGGAYVRCPLESEHSPGPRNPSSTFVSPTGALWCSKKDGHLRGRMREALAAVRGGSR